MILDLVESSRDFYISNQVGSKFIYLLLDLNIIGLYIKNF